MAEIIEFPKNNEVYVNEELLGNVDVVNIPIDGDISDYFIIDGLEIDTGEVDE